MVRKKLFRSSNEGVFWSIVLLCVIGIWNIYSASYYNAYNDPDGKYYLFAFKQFGAFLLGIGAMIFIARVDYRQTRTWGLLLGGISIALLIGVALFGLEEGGARRWIRIGIIFQPSELAKVAAVLLTAAYLGPKIDRKELPQFACREFAMVVAMGALVLKQPDMGTAAIIVAISLSLYLITGLSSKQKRFLMLTILAGTGYFAASAPYRWERIMSWVDPWEKAGAQGYQAVQAQMTIGSGGLFGTGVGQGMSKFYYLPEAHTDFAFAMYCQEMGFVGAVFLLFLFGIFTCYGMRIAFQAKDGYGKLLAFGMTLLISGQAVANMAIVTGLLPVIGCPLPFISYGGTSMLINMICVGFLLGVGRPQSKRKRKLPPRPIAEEVIEEGAPPNLKLVRPESDLEGWKR